MVSLASFVGSFPCVAFSGSRVSSSSASVSCRAFLPVLGGLSASVGVGCASGVDSVVRSAFTSASVLVVSPASVSSAWFGALASRFCCVGAAPCGGLLWVASSVPLPVGGQLSLF